MLVENVALQRAVSNLLLPCHFHKNHGVPYLVSQLAHVYSMVYKRLILYILYDIVYDYQNFRGAHTRVTHLLATKCMKVPSFGTGMQTNGKLFVLQRAHMSDTFTGRECVKICGVCTRE